MLARDKELLAHAIEKKIARLKIILQQDEPENADLLSDLEHDEAARLNKVSNIQVDKTLSNLASLELHALRFNLEWLKGDEAGECEDCGETIPLQRLLAVPTTRKCVKCAVESA